MTYAMKKTQKYGALIVKRDFRPQVYQTLETLYGADYQRDLEKAKQHFAAKLKVTNTEDNVDYVYFGPYNEKLNGSEKLSKDLAWQRKKFGSLVNIPTKEDDNLERITEIIM